jgi:excinuclease UvrABC nuclease subunit
MNVKDLTPNTISRSRFDLSAFKQVPSEAGCYILSTFTGDILYIGLATNLNTRFLQHLNNPEKTSATIEGKAIWFYYLLFNANNLPQLERTWLNQFAAKHGKRPLLNKKDSPVS